MQIVDIIHAVFRATYPSRVGREYPLTQTEMSDDTVGEGERRISACVHALQAAYPNTSIRSVDGSSCHLLGRLNSIPAFEFEIKATEDYNPDPRETDSYGTYLSLVFNGQGAYRHLRIQSKNEQVLFIRHV